MEIHEIPLQHIRPAPWNPPERMDEKSVKGLADSIKKEGQRVAGLVRPVEDDVHLYELVYGHRRFAACRLIAAKNGGMTFRAAIEEMDDTRSMVLGAIENLQRENPSDYEEAVHFKTLADQYGETAVKQLAESLSLKERHVRKRLAMLELPESVVEWWKKGHWTSGHLEQLLRLGDNDKVLEFLEDIDHDTISVGRLADLIGRQALPLENAQFDTEECKSCAKNTAKQKQLFGLANGSKAHCLDWRCYQDKQQAWYDLNWQTCNKNKFGTKQALVTDRYGVETIGDFGWELAPMPKCLDCGHFTTIISLGRNFALREKVCMGESTCFAEAKKLNKAAKKANKKAENGVIKTDPDAPRVAWHGEFYRQEFYHQGIPRLMQELSLQDPRRLQISLAFLVNSNRHLKRWFWQAMGHEVPEDATQHMIAFNVKFPHLLSECAKLDTVLLVTYLGEAAGRLALLKERGYETTITDPDRQAIAQLLDIDFKEFQVTETYLNKKTKAELLTFILKESFLWGDKEFLRYLKGRGIEKEEQLAKAKKTELIGFILNCGLDLRGRLPKEIKNLPEV